MGGVPARKRRKLSPEDFSDSDYPQSSKTAAKPTTRVAAFIANASKWSLEQEYETKPRKSKKKEKENTRLPIKTAEGRIEQMVVPDVKEEEEEDSWLSSDDDLKSDVEESVEVKAEESKISSRQQILEAKEELARIASLINEEPEEHVNGFRTLAQFASSSNITVRKLALATQLAVYKDVIPGYRIRPLGDLDQTEKVSKEVRRLRTYEQSLVSSYQTYVRELAKHAKSSRGNVTEAVASLAAVAISCACALLLSVPHFNFRGDLIKILVTKLSGKRIDNDFIKCRETLETLFRDDEDGTASLDVVTMLTRMMKARNYHIHESVLNTFLQLRLLSEFSSKGSQNHIDRVKPDTINGKKHKFQKEFRTKKQRKLLKERKAIAKEFKEADAIVSHEERDRMQAETLKLVFITYFRILKSRNHSLTGAVLEGLAKYAHLINQDFFGDILEALKDLITLATAAAEPESIDGITSSDDDEVPVTTRNAARESLLCIITAFALLEGQDAHKAATSLSLDLSFFTTHLYRSLHSLSLDPDLELHTKPPQLPDTASASLAQTPRINVQTTPALLLRALSSVLLPPIATHSVPPVRVAAFSKQLLSCALHLPEKSTLAVMGLMGKVVKTHGKKIAGMWNTEERKGDGEYDPLKGEVEVSNPFAATVWEGELLRLHFCPEVRGRYVALEKDFGDGG
jgi:nucleolar complex protein 3